MDETLRPLIKNAEILARVKELGAQITRDYAGRPLVLVGVLKGAFMFVTDLARAIDLPLGIEFVRASSYVGVESSGAVKIARDIGPSLTGADVLLVDDIADTRLTLRRLIDEIARFEPASVKVACLLDKPSRARFPVTIDYVGFTIKDEFVVGYGLDLDEQFRNLPDVAIYDPNAQTAAPANVAGSAGAVKIPAPEVRLPEIGARASLHPPRPLSSFPPARARHATFGLLLPIGERVLETTHGEFRAHVYQNLYTRAYALAVCHGKLRGEEPLLTRVHSACITSEAFGACDCDCAEQLDLAMARIAQAGRGVVFYLMQEGRGAGYAAKARDRMIVQASNNTVTTFDAYAKLGLDRDHRRYNEVAPMLLHLGVRAPLRLLTNNPDKTRALAEQGIVVTSNEQVQREASAFNVHYLASKRKSGHSLASDLLGKIGAELPEPVHSFEPTPLEGASYLVRMASYLLPLRVGEGDALAWFRSHVYFDLLAGCERVVLTYGEEGGGKDLPTLVRLQHESLFDRFPLKNAAATQRWRSTVAQIVRHGSGVVVFPSADGEESLVVSGLGAAPLSSLTAGLEVDDAIAVLLKHHVPGGRVTPIANPLDDASAGPALHDTLERHGLILTAPTLLEAG